MKKALILVMCLGIAAAVAPCVFAADDETKYTISGDVFTGYEYINNYENFSDNKALPSDEFTAWPYRYRVGVDANVGSNIHVFAQFQGYGNFGQNFASAPSFDVAWNPIEFMGNTSKDAVFYQGYIDLKNLGTDNLSLRVGRQEHTFGTQLLLGNNDFYSGQSFDGARLMYGAKDWGVEGFYYKLNEEFTHSMDFNLFGADGTFKVGSKMGEVGAYVFVTQQMSQFTEDVVLPPGLIVFPGEKLETYGARWGRMVNNAQDMKDMAFDWNVEAAFQSGDWRETDFPKVDFGGSLFEGWFGYNFGTGAGRSRAHIGLLMASGQKATDADTKENDFIPLFGDRWVYNRLGDLDAFDISDITDFNIGYEYTSGSEKHSLMVALHSLALAEDVTFGTTKEKDLGTELDVRYGYKINGHTTIDTGIAYLSPGKVVDHEAEFQSEGTVTSADPIERFWAKLRVRW